MPVEARDLDNLVAARAVFVKPAFHTKRDNEQIDNTGGHVQTVESGDHEEARTELCRAKRVLPWTHAFGNEFRPLVRLHANE